MSTQPFCSTEMEVSLQFSISCPLTYPLSFYRSTVRLDEILNAFCWGISWPIFIPCVADTGDSLEHPSSSSVELCAHTTTHNKSTKHFIRADGYISSEPALCVLLRCTVVDQVRLKTRMPVLSQRNSLTPYSHRHDDTSRGQWGMTTPHNRRIVWQSRQRV